MGSGRGGASDSSWIGSGRSADMPVGGPQLAWKDETNAKSMHGQASSRLRRRSAHRPRQSETEASGGNRNRLGAVGVSRVLKICDGREGGVAEKSDARLVDASVSVGQVGRRSRQVHPSSFCCENERQRKAGLESQKKKERNGRCAREMEGGRKRWEGQGKFLIGRSVPLRLLRLRVSSSTLWAGASGCVAGRACPVYTSLLLRN